MKTSACPCVGKEDVQEYFTSTTCHLERLQLRFSQIQIQRRRSPLEGQPLAAQSSLEVVYFIPPAGHRSWCHFHRLKQSCTHVLQAPLMPSCWLDWSMVDKQANYSFLVYRQLWRPWDHSKTRSRTTSSLVVPCALATGFGADRYGQAWSNF